MYKLLIDSKVAQKRFDVSSITTEISIKFERIGTATKFEFTLIKDDIAIFHEGDAVSFYDNEIPIFYGYIFTKSKDNEEVIKVSCYDQLRYLKAKDSEEFIGSSAGDVIKILANKFQLTVGKIVGTGYKIPYQYHEDESLFDMITYHLQQAKINTNTEYNFYDNFGQLTLDKAEDMVIKNCIIGTGDIATNKIITKYTYKTDIDKNTYNQIKIVRPNEATKKGDVYESIDPETIKKWGLLQYYEVVDENLNEAQIIEYKKLLFEYYNKVSRTLTLSCIGFTGLRAGNTVYLNIPNIGDISLDKAVLIDSVSHKYKNSDHTMELELTVR